MNGTFLPMKGLESAWDARMTPLEALKIGTLVNNFVGMTALLPDWMAGRWTTPHFWRNGGTPMEQKIPLWPGMLSP
ncbi:hypothetical protein KQ313_06450 [Synechococcus sp. CS-1325]|uniref:hypothetical protein n=1 Tax=Synechococcus sp. CS-1325 TaxID=2847979 RepID=UPI00223B6CE6|nr:hypothetical protein [Synechococcus sp. CS-1325]MCT0199315.1 hypothetical protein [Synechococcus sp. CS-1325]